MKMKKLLAAALAATMMLSSMVTSMVASAETTNAVKVTIADIAVGATEFTANFDIDFDPEVDGPHLMFDVDAEGATLTDIKSNTEYIAVEAEDGGANLAEGMFIVEGSGGKVIDVMSLTATFTLAEAAKDGDVIIVNVAVTDNADWNENTITIADGTDEFEVKAPHECDMQTKYDENGHWTECTCGEKTDVVAHTLGDAAEAEDGKWYQSCECGYSVEVDAPVVEAVPVDFTIRNPALMVKEKYGFRIRIDKGTTGYTDANGKVANYDHYEILLETKEYVGSNYTLTDVVKTFDAKDIDSSSTSSRDYYFYKNVTAYALNVPIDLTVKFYDANNNYVAYSNTLTFDIASLTKEKLAASGTAANLKNVYMDMLNYGAATQVYFSKMGTNNGLLSAESITKGCDEYQKYATTALPTLTGTSVPNDVSGKGFVVTPGLQASSSNNIYYRFTVPASLSVNDLKVTLTHTDLYGKEVKNMYALKDMEPDNKGRYVLAYDAVAIYDSAAVVNAVITDAQGNTIYTFDYNIDYYVNSKITAANPDAVYVALAKFSVSAMNYFKSLI